MLDGKSAIVTGGSSGIGRAVVERYLDEWKRVIDDASYVTGANVPVDSGWTAH